MSGHGSNHRRVGQLDYHVAACTARSLVLPVLADSTPAIALTAASLWGRRLTRF